MLVKDKVRSECYGYAITVSRGVLRGLIFPHAHFPDMYRYRRGQTLYSFTSMGLRGPQEADGLKWKPAFFCYVV